ncbi:2-phytyl-1,4-beta-naphthoquinone methyltransferase, chloroplastic [Vitis vinifera]|uniref:2-phytyl-1,4-beta-naphthoquinone methyltransferase, chloroplastic n=1 Tax=Vitis vinifera TaxID=29760 RepID=A0A438E6Z1_VITVI|nr:2-phytyl-1,4-beta-naphthoquinone methyltransferase, chloroplastic [Vitis vinifera]RVX04428.1 2-phytyl-1,4-beta-naphthoquinone methyltransferase, chloroplastic [Vitis vinifera]
MIPTLKLLFCKPNLIDFETTNEIVILACINDMIKEFCIGGLTLSILSQHLINSKAASFLMDNHCSDEYQKPMKFFSLDRHAILSCAHHVIIIFLVYGITCGISPIFMPSYVLFICFSFFKEWMIDNVVVPVATGYGLADEYAYLKSSVQEFLTGKELEKLALEMGFSNAKHYEIGGGIMGNLVAKR